MTDHIWDGRPLGGRRRRYKIAGCSRALLPSTGNNPYDEEFAGVDSQPRWTTRIVDIDTNVTEQFRAHPDISFEEYVQRFWEENASE